MDNSPKLSPVEQALAELNGNLAQSRSQSKDNVTVCLLYTSDAADE